MMSLAVSLDQMTGNKHKRIHPGRVGKEVRADARCLTWRSGGLQQQLGSSRKANRVGREEE